MTRIRTASRIQSRFLSKYSDCKLAPAFNLVSCKLSNFELFILLTLYIVILLSLALRLVPSNSSSKNPARDTYPA